MKIEIIRTKAGKSKQLSSDIVLLDTPPASLDNLLAELTAIGLREAQKRHEDKPIDAEQESGQAAIGRVRFAERYNTDTHSLEKALDIMRQDFKDGLFRVFIDSEEVTTLDSPVQLEEGSKITLLKLVMLAGRLW